VLWLPAGAAAVATTAATSEGNVPSGSRRADPLLAMTDRIR
jgi:hypothetical protein